MSHMPESGGSESGAAHDFEALFREHAARIYRVAYRVTGNGTDAEDVLQTIFLRMLRREGASRGHEGASRREEGDDGDFVLGPQAFSYFILEVANGMRKVGSALLDPSFELGIRLLEQDLDAFTLADLLQQCLVGCFKLGWTREGEGFGDQWDEDDRRSDGDPSGQDFYATLEDI